MSTHTHTHTFLSGRNDINPNWVESSTLMLLCQTFLPSLFPPVTTAAVLSSQLHTAWHRVDFKCQLSVVDNWQNYSR